jgi:hypothetical protein
MSTLCLSCRRYLMTAGVIVCILGVQAVSAGITYATVAKPFGIKSFSLEPTNEAGQPYAFTQAGGHPWALTGVVQFDSEEIGNAGLFPTRDPKDVVVSLPPGLLGDPMAVPRCPATVVLTRGETCPSDTQIGIVRIHWQGSFEEVGPIVNMTPEAGQSAEFGLENLQHVVPVLTAHLVHTEQGYGFTVASHGIPIVDLVEVETSFWGVPADTSHDPWRGRFCQRQVGETGGCQQGGEHSGLPRVPFLTMPTDCSSGAQVATVRADSWQEPGHVSEGRYSEQYKEATASMPAVTGCNALQFRPSIELRPDTLLADAPVGLGVDLSFPQNEIPESHGTPQLRDAVVTLPEGMSVSPGVVDGIQACNETGPEGINVSGPESEEVALDGEL